MGTSIETVLDLLETEIFSNPRYNGVYIARDTTGFAITREDSEDYISIHVQDYECHLVAQLVSESIYGDYNGNYHVKLDRSYTKDRIIKALEQLLDEDDLLRVANYKPICPMYDTTTIFNYSTSNPYTIDSTKL